MYPRQRIVYVASTDRGGSAFSLLHLVRALNRKRYEPIVIFYAREQGYVIDQLHHSGITTLVLNDNPSPPEASRLENVARPRNIAQALEKKWGPKAASCYHFFKGVWGFLQRDLKQVWSLFWIYRQLQPQTVHVNNGLRLNRAAVIAAWLRQVPCICHVRAMGQLSEFDRLLQACVTQFIFISQAVANHYIAQGMTVQAGCIVHNAVDLKEFGPWGDAIHHITPTRAEFGLSTEHFVIGMFGRLDWWKGHEYFIEALAQLVPQLPTIRGVIVGERENTLENQAYAAKLDALVEQNALQQIVIFTGFRTDVPRLMSAFDVIVLGSSAPEPFGRVVIEGMAAGKPVIATAAGGVLDIINDGVTGLLIPARDAEAMASAIFDLYHNRPKAQRLGRQARDYVVSNFNSQIHAQRIEQIYQRFALVH